MQYIFVNRYFHPDHSATSQILSDLAFALRERGYDITVITSQQLYDRQATKLSRRETVFGVDVRRVRTTRFGRSNLFGRAFDYLTFYVMASLSLWLTARRGDVIIAKTDPPMLSIPSAVIAFLRGAYLINWLQDIFPEIAEKIGKSNGSWLKMPYAIMRIFRNLSLRRADVNVVIGERMREKVAGLAVPDERIALIPNWANGASVRARSGIQNALRRAWRVENRFVIGYSGNLGRAHEFETILNAISLLERPDVCSDAANCHVDREARNALPAAEPGHSGDITWLFVGDGALRAKFEAEIEARRLTSVQFRPYQPRERLAETLSVADVHLVSLRPELEGFIVPSKYYGVAAAGRPAIFIGDDDGEVARILKAEQCGWTIRTGDGAGLASLIKKLARDREMVCEAGRRARHVFERRFDFPIALNAWDRIFKHMQGLSANRHNASDGRQHSVAQHSCSRKA